MPDLVITERPDWVPDFVGVEQDRDVFALSMERPGKSLDSAFLSGFRLGLLAGRVSATTNQAR
ncbi:hypothetical protein [Tsukamurella sp. PLM1]|uniref:hypothetical protein n=1 Tax=Tsukamurella sp. PLM1 TaxID=2929795 RepID=UPI0020C05B76|nr:hypothetical protein [Tsukamurella sp. PLM1]